VNIEHSLVLSLIKYGNIKKIISFFSENEMLIPEHKNHFLFIKNYYKKYLESPKLETVKSEFPNCEFEIQDSIENETFYADSILDRNNKEKMMKVFKAGSENIVANKKLKNIYEFVFRNLRKINVHKEDILSGNLGRDTQERLKRYEEKNKRKDLRYKWGFSLNDRSIIDSETPISPGRVYLIQARPNVGKTFFACAAAVNLSKQKIRSLFISKEMSVEEVLERMDAFAAEVSFTRLKNGLLNEKELQQYKTYLEKSENKVDVEVKHPIECTQETVRQLIEENNPGAVFIDFLQLLKDSSNERDVRLQMKNVIYDFKKYSQIYNIPIIVISATNREGAKREDAPDIENISESDSIGFAVDVLFSLYQKESDEITHTMRLKCAKNRHGKKYTTNLMWDIDQSVISEQN
jgi:replicative DNA helicase